MIFGLKDETIQRITSVLKKFPQINKAILYGSRAKGNYKKGSDIDLTLVGDDLNLSVINLVEIEIDNLLLPYTFDISIYHQIDNSELIEYIKRVGKIFYSKSN